MNGNAEFSLHVFKQRSRGQTADRYTIGIWVSAREQRAICHDACIDSALAALRKEMEKAGQRPVVPASEVQHLDTSH